MSFSQNIFSIFNRFHWEILSFMSFSQNIILFFHQFHWEILSFMSFQWVNHKHKMVQWVWNGLKLITKAKNYYILIYIEISRNSTVGILYWKIDIVSFWYCGFCTGSTRISSSILIWYFLIFKNQYDIFRWFVVCGACTRWKIR